MKLNCDLGEGYGTWKMQVDHAVMPFIDQANIACGMHGGDPLVIKQAIGLAKRHNVSIGAHPSYPDLQGFGRRSMRIPSNELEALIHYQLAVVDGLCRQAGVTMDYVKPHGALYNDMMKDATLRQIVMKAVATYREGMLPLMLQAHPNFCVYQKEAEQFDLSLYFEAFADRRYSPEGYLTPRIEAGAILCEEEAIQQVQVLLDHQGVYCSDGSFITMPVDTICVHGDSEGAIAMAQSIRRLIETRS